MVAHPNRYDCQTKGLHVSSRGLASDRKNLITITLLGGCQFDGIGLFEVAKAGYGVKTLVLRLQS